MTTPSPVSSGLTFLHEALHPKVGHKVRGQKYGYYKHANDGSSDYKPGRTVSVINQIRGELRLATRINYYHGKWNPGISWQQGSEKIRVLSEQINAYKAKFEKTTRPTLLKLQPIFNINQ
ncbi:MAG: hypothetical protein R2828_35760 [Saprospiraceae bacterium]